MKQQFRTFLLIVIISSIILARWVFGGTKYLDPIYSVKSSNNVKYGEAMGFNKKNESLLLDLYEPEDGGVELRPLIIFIHGGSFVGGDKSNHTDYATNFAKKGYVAASINYRMNSSHAPYKFGAQDIHVPLDIAVEDALSSIKFFVENADKYKIDTNKIFIGGSSAGAMTALYASYVEDPPAELIRGTFSMAGAVQSADFSIIDTADPMTIMFHGSLDHTVPYDQALATSKNLNDKGVTISFITYDGVAHGVKELRKDDIEKKTADFFYATVNKQSASAINITPTLAYSPVQTITPTPTLEGRERPPTYPSDYPTPTVKYVAPGDINGDGKIDVLDMNLLINNYLGSDKSMDLNLDGVINGNDYFLLGQKLNTIAR